MKNDSIPNNKRAKVTYTCVSIILVKTNTIYLKLNKIPIGQLVRTYVNYCNFVDLTFTLKLCEQVGSNNKVLNTFDERITMNGATARRQKQQ